MIVGTFTYKVVVTDSVSNLSATLNASLFVYNTQTDIADISPAQGGNETTQNVTENLAENSQTSMIAEQS